ncbi:hypothetical protein ACYOEI_20255 [Singulisphaera rosea]
MGKAHGRRRRRSPALEPLDTRVLPSAMIEAAIPSSPSAVVATSRGPSPTVPAEISRTPDVADVGEESGSSVGFLEPSSLANNSHLILSDAVEDSREVADRHKESDLAAPSVVGQPPLPQVLITETTTSTRPSQTSGHETSASPLGPSPTIQVPPVADPSLSRAAQPDDAILPTHNGPGGSRDPKSRALPTGPEPRVLPRSGDLGSRSTSEGVPSGIGSESPLPRAAGLISSVFPFDHTALDRVLDGSLGRGREFGSQLTRWQDPLSVVQILLTASILTSGYRWFLRRFVDRGDAARRVRNAGLIIPGIPGLPRR